MRKILIVLMFFSFNPLISQETLAIKEVYIDNNLAYKSVDDHLFTGIAQSKRKNGHLSFEEEYKNGIILSYSLYYNGKEKRVSNKTIYNPDKPFVVSKKHKYHLEGEIYETITYNDDGVKILEEQFINGELTYSCQYLGKKKHGIEYCHNKKGIEIKNEYRNGKKIK